MERTVLVGIILDLVATSDGGRRESVLNATDGGLYSYRPNWRLPSMTGHEQTAAPVVRFARSPVAPGESVHAVIQPPYPELWARWRAEVVPGVRMPMYEGSRVCGWATVLWTETLAGSSLGDQDVADIERRLADPDGPPPVGA